MSVSNIKRVQNEIEQILNSSDRNVPSNSYYLVTLTVQNLSIEEVKKLGKKFLSENPDNLPLCVYIYENKIAILFSCVADTHHKDGSHSTLISEYVSKVFIYTDTQDEVEGKIIEMKSRADVLMYFTYIVHTHEQQSIVRESNGVITKSDTAKKTQNELLNILSDNSIEWDDLPCHRRYGTFYKLKKIKKKYTVVSISETLDARESKRYISFIFG